MWHLAPAARHTLLTIEEVVKFHCISLNTKQGKGGLWRAPAWHHRLKQPWSYSDLCQRLNQENQEPPRQHS